jgi:hypothetical protein
MIGLDELKVPKALRPVVDEIVAITDSVCLAVLDEEYADLARRAMAKLARKRPPPRSRESSKIRERAGDAITATNLIDEVTYRIRANAGPDALTPMRPGCFMTARIVPVADGWMLSGAQRLFAASQRAAILRLATELATGHPEQRRTKGVSDT